MPIIQSAVGNGAGAQGNKPTDVKLVKGLIRKVLPQYGGPLPSIANSIDPGDPKCDAMLIAALANFQKAHVTLRSEAPSGGRLDPWGRTIIALQGSAELSDNVRTAGKSEEMAKQLEKWREIWSEHNAQMLALYRKQDAPASLNAKVSAAKQWGGDGKDWLIFDLDKFMNAVLPSKTTLSIGSDFGLGGGVLLVNGGVAKMKIDDSATSASREYHMISVGAGVSVAPISLSYSDSTAPSWSSNIYKGPGSAEGPTLEGLDGSCVVILSGAVTGLAYGGAVNILFMGFPSHSTLMVQLSNPSGLFYGLQKAPAVAFMAGGQLGTPDAGVSIQFGVMATPKGKGSVDFRGEPDGVRRPKF